MTDLLKAGPWGGIYDGDKSFEFDYSSSRLTQIRIWSDKHGVQTIQFAYIDASNESHTTEAYGNPESLALRTVVLADNEQLIEISGTYGRQDGRVVITSLSLKSSLNNTFGPYGVEGGLTFSLGIPVEVGKVVGFFGQYGSRLDNLGVTVKLAGD